MTTTNEERRSLLPAPGQLATVRNDDLDIQVTGVIVGLAKGPDGPMLRVLPSDRLNTLLEEWVPLPVQVTRA